ncbi:Pre-mRNA-splicing factor 38B [Geodia barretti]|uniref:Pre-mRNA-splicing factor 38 n=2 Tax=Geodia barretti TaxID=519541 RepID=A0AA35R369_GEOBA|nr:Pre-mRNA-splicing factor 38B [Geodia barretti]
MLDHVDSPFIRGLGFMYIRYCQPPLDLWDWFEPYLDDPEEIDLKAGGGFKTTVGAMCRMMLIKLDWFGTMLPRISVSVSKTLQQKLTAASQPDRALPGDEERRDERENGGAEEEREREKERAGRDVWGEAARRARPDQPERREKRSPPPPAKRSRSQSRDRDRRDNRRRRSRSRERRRSHSREKPRRRSRSRSRDRRRRSSSRERRARSRSRSKGAWGTTEISLEGQTKEQVS